MDAYLDKARDIWEGQIDFEGQRLAEVLSNVLLSVVGVTAFLAGYISDNITYTLWLLLGGAAFALLIVVPPWPFYNRNPVKWLPSTKTSGGTSFNIVVDGKKVQ
ncbi:microsomal signal peptidase 12 kDa subunit-domain-containing protein [Elsinoe ampelina]|uniref:Signal peptidase complex subunit 1 n=1 Tax=Elsinoe ampelina TaxID=302913 RepID=A0A6A6FZZ6_9PEZI|nr:microsomal signal peptidase 12 kDa subunit-domain-containing protein [Elsinoe ampelina]